MSKEQFLPRGVGPINLQTDSLEGRTLASRLVINSICEKVIRNGVTLPPITYTGLVTKKGEGSGKVYWIPQGQFRIMEEFCNSFRCGKQSARILDISISTLRNQKNEVFKRFNIKNSKNDHSCDKTLRLFLKLLKLGIITIEPSVKKDSFKKFRPRGGKKK